MPNKFHSGRRADVLRLVTEYPLAWLIANTLHASPLPLMAETDDDGEIVALLGHCAIRNPLVADFRKNAHGVILFSGPAGYISPGLVSKPDWAPTWNYAVLRFKVEIEFVAEQTREAIEELVAFMESGKSGHWSTERLGARYEAMLDRIIAFRAHVRSTDHHFKLGQDESGEIFGEIVARHSDRTLAEWMEEQSDR